MSPLYTLRFVPQPRSNQTLREKEIEISAQKSHAARISHRAHRAGPRHSKDTQRNSNGNQKYCNEEESDARNKHASQQRRPRERSRYQQPLPGYKSHRRAQNKPIRGKYDETHPLVQRATRPWAILGPVVGSISAILPCNLPDAFVKEELRNLPNTLADLLSSGTSGTRYGKSLAISMMSHITDNPVALHSMLLGGYLHDVVQQGATRVPSIAFEVGTKAIIHLNREISDPQYTVSDPHIWCVIVLAYAGGIAPLRSARSSPRQSFLKELQSIHIYSRMEIVAMHVVGLIKMIELRGGLHKIEIPGMAQVISLAGIIGASRTIQKPIFPFVPLTDTFMVDGELCVSMAEREAAAAGLGPLGTGFSKVWNTSSFPAIQGLLHVIRLACDLTIVVENYTQGEWRRPEIIDQRNYVQHALLSLPTSQDLNHRGIEVHDSHYESCRLATIIYSILIIFPIPPVFGPFEILTRKLRQELEKISLESQNSPRLEMHLWILVMGAIASLGLSDRPWFLSKTLALSQALDLHEWRDLKRVLESFLWHYNTSDVDGIDVWVDSIRMSETNQIRC